MPGFSQRDFAVFSVAGLEARMAAIAAQVRPKLTEIGREIEPFLTALTGGPMVAHVAKHARRTVNPPDDTWVAWANNKRGYKAYPHFEMGLFATHVYIQFAIVYESGHKAVLAENMWKKPALVLSSVPENFLWSSDRAKPMDRRHDLLQLADIAEMANKLHTSKRYDVLCGINLGKDDETVADGAKLLTRIETTYEALLPLYRMAF